MGTSQTQHTGISGSEADFLLHSLFHVFHNKPETLDTLLPTASE